MFRAFKLGAISDRKGMIIAFLCAVMTTFLVSSCATAPSRDNMNKAESHTKLGSSYLDNGQVNEAFTEFQKAIKLNPRSTKTLNYLGYLSMRFKKYDEAISYYKKAISIDPDYSEAMNNLGVTYAETGNWDEAVTYFDSALANPMYETPESAYANKGYVLYMKGDYINAERAVKEALIINRLFPMASYVLGLVYTKLDNDAAAIEEFKKAIGLAPDYVEAHMDLAKTYLRSGNKAKALKHFEAVLDLDNNTLRLREASDHISRLKY
jgi:type IV pilus biogenesis/stability protein PilW